MYKVVTESAETLIPLADFKEFARVTTCVASDEMLMETLLSASIDFCEKYTGLSIALKTYEKIFSFTKKEKITYDTFELRKGVVTEVLEISENYESLESNLVDLTDIEIDNFKQCTSIFVPNGMLSSGTHPTRPLVAKFNAGWTEETLPKHLKVAIMQLAAYWYENRETVQLLDNTNIAEMPFATSSILNMYRLVRM